MSRGPWPEPFIWWTRQAATWSQECQLPTSSILCWEGLCISRDCPSSVPPGFPFLVLHSPTPLSSPNLWLLLTLYSQVLTIVLIVHTHPRPDKHFCVGHVSGSLGKQMHLLPCDSSKVKSKKFSRHHTMFFCRYSPLTPSLSLKCSQSFQIPVQLSSKADQPIWLFLIYTLRDPAWKSFYNLRYFTNRELSPKCGSDPYPHLYWSISEVK